MTKYKEAFRAWRETQYGPGPTPGDKECPYCKKVGGHECNCFGPPAAQDDLVKRLRTDQWGKTYRTNNWYDSHGYYDFRGSICIEAADRIEQLEMAVSNNKSWKNLRIKALEDESQMWANQIPKLHATIEKLEAKIKALNSFLRGVELGIEEVLRLALKRGVVDEVSLSPGVGVPTGNDHGC